MMAGAWSCARAAVHSSVPPLHPSPPHHQHPSSRAMLCNPSLNYRRLRIERKVASTISPRTLISPWNETHIELKLHALALASPLSKIIQSLDHLWPAFQHSSIPAKCGLNVSAFDSLYLRLIWIQFYFFFFIIYWLTPQVTGAQQYDVVHAMSAAIRGEPLKMRKFWAIKDCQMCDVHKWNVFR